MESQILFGQEADDFATRSHGPQVVIREGGQQIAFNEARDLIGVPESLHPWARRWGPVLANDDAFVANSVLDKREWAELDRTIFEMVKLRRNAYADVVGRGLVKQSNLAEMLSQWRMATERTRPSVSMDGRTRADRDRTDRLVYSVPVPIIRTDYEIGARELLASRKLGSPLDTFEAGEAASAVGEEQERMLIAGHAGIVLAGFTIYGYTTLPARDTGTAAAYGGGDFGAIANVTATFAGMLGALAAKRYHGPFMAYVAATQYNQMLDFYTDGTVQTAVDRVKTWPQVEDVKPSDFLTDGHAVLVQMTRNVVEIVEALSVQNREWTSPDGQAHHYAVMAASAPRLKTDSDGNAGIAHATAC